MYIVKSRLLGSGTGDYFTGESSHTEYLASNHMLTILWKFIPEDIYYKKELFADRVLFCTMALNVWFFFVRKNCFPQCLSNLFASLTGSKGNTDGVTTFAQRRNLIDILVVQWMVGIVFMPGAHIQF